MDFTCFEGFLKSDGKVLRNRQSKVLTSQQFRQLCLDNDVLFKKEESEAMYNLALKQLLPKMAEKPKEFSQKEAIDMIDKKELFKGFVAKGSMDSDLLIYYKLNEKKTLLLGSSLDLNSRTVHQILKSKKELGNILERWKSLIEPYSKILKINPNDNKEVVDAVWERFFSVSKEMDFEEIDFSRPPAILEGFGKGTEYTIPFTKKLSTLSDLNPILRSFLERMSDHKYFCAIIASRLIGFKWHYIPWLFGKGGDGKSTFTRFLGYIVPNGSATIRIGDPNGLWEAIGKTFLIFPDTANKNLIMYEEVKNISGGDSVSIAGKYKHARTEVLPGQIIATSNRLPNVGSSEALKRRARVFTIEPGNFQNTDEELSVEQAASSMYESVNPFINYCLQCLEEVGDIKTGRVPSHPSNIVNKQIKTSAELEFHDFIESKNLVLMKDFSIKGIELRKMLAEEKNKDQYFKDNFLEYIENHKGVYTDGKFYFGIGREKYSKGEN